MATAARHPLNARFAAPALPNRHATTTRRPRPRAADQPKLTACPRTRRRSRSTRRGAMLRTERSRTGLPEKPGIAAPQGTSAVGGDSQLAPAALAIAEPDRGPSPTPSVIAAATAMLRSITENDCPTASLAPRQPTPLPPLITTNATPSIARSRRTQRTPTGRRLQPQHLEAPAGPRATQ